MADIGKYGGKITITASTTPSNYKITILSKPEWVNGDNSSINENWVGTVYSNGETNDRSGSINAKVETFSDPGYQGTASMERTWNFTQEGTGLVGYGINFVFASNTDYGETFTLEVRKVSGSGESGVVEVEGISESGTIGGGFQNGDSIALVFKNSSQTHSVGIAYTTSSPSYTYETISGGGIKTLNTTANQYNYFYIQIQ